jgi:hypothetical protein
MDGRRAGRENPESGDGGGFCSLGTTTLYCPLQFWFAPSLVGISRISDFSILPQEVSGKLPILTPPEKERRFFFGEN